MIEQILGYTIPAAYAVLPPKMKSDGATAFLLAVAMQESRLTARRQLHGPARGFWMFEANGVRGVLEHERSDLPIAQALKALCYDPTLDPPAILMALEHNDVLAACFARCLLWTSPAPLPTTVGAAWRLYTDLWRPGQPHAASWPALYLDAATIVTSRPV